MVEAWISSNAGVPVWGEQEMRWPVFKLGWTWKGELRIKPWEKGQSALHIYQWN